MGLLLPSLDIQDVTCESEFPSDTKSAGILVLDFPGSQDGKQSMSVVYKVPQFRVPFIEQEIPC